MENRNVVPDLRYADLHARRLSHITFDEVNLFRANLSHTDLREAKIRRTYLGSANLSSADLTDTDLGGSHLGRADLSQATLIRSKIRGVTLYGAHLSNTDFSHAEMAWTVLSEIDLTTIKGLDTVRHIGPSSVGIETLLRSKGQVSEHFLRSAGVPEHLIQYARSCTTRITGYYSCFISYSSNDHAFAERLHADIRAHNLRCWFAPEDLKIGDAFQERIEESIRLYDKVMIVLSEASVQSRWVEREVNAAREREADENRIILFPIRIDDAVMNATQAWAAEIRRTRHIGDFRSWTVDVSYRMAFERLLRDLKATDQSAERQK